MSKKSLHAASRGHHLGALSALAAIATGFTLTAAEPNGGKSAAQAGRASLRVVDREGQPVARFEVNVSGPEEIGSDWAPGKDGQAALDAAIRRLAETDALCVIVRADGFAPTAVPFAGPDREKLLRGEGKIVLERGEPVEIVFRLPPTMSWPQGLEPRLFFDVVKDGAVFNSMSGRGWAAVDQNLLGVRWTQPGVAKLRLAGDTPQFHAAINAAGFLRFFTVGPLAPADFKDGKLVIDVPQPGQLEISFHPSAQAGQQLPFQQAELELCWRLPATLAGGAIEAGRHESREPWPAWKLTDLAPGGYSADVRTVARPEVKDLPGVIFRPVNPGVFNELERIQLKEGQADRIDFAYVPLDVKSLHGDRTAKLRILKCDGSPAAGEKIVIGYVTGNYGLFAAFSGTVGESGIVTASGLTDRAVEGVDEPYSVDVVKGEGDKRELTRLGWFGFSSGASSQEFTFRLPPDVGDLAPDVPLVNMTSGKGARLAEFRGKVVLVDFWATWCGPCQEPMAHLNQMALDKRAEWGDRIVILPLSVDKDVEMLKQHVVSRAWTNLDHFWVGGEGDKKGWQAPAVGAFGIDGVPTSLLIGRDGRILWRGNPAEGDVAAKIADALRN